MPDATPKEIRDCRKRIRERVRRLRAGVVPKDADPEVAPDAVIVFRFACGTCGLCPGLANLKPSRNPRKMYGTGADRACRLAQQAEAMAAVRSQQLSVARLRVKALLARCDECRRCVGL